MPSFPDKLWLSFAVCSRADRKGAESLNLQVSYSSVNLCHSRISTDPVPQKQKIQLSAAFVHGISPLNVIVYVMSDRARMGRSERQKVVLT